MTTGDLTTLRTYSSSTNILSEPIAQLLERAGPIQRPIHSRWHRQEIAHWRRVPAEAVCEVKFSNVDASRWFKYATTLLRWRPDLSPQDCRVDQLTLA